MHILKKKKKGAAIIMNPMNQSIKEEEKEDLKKPNLLEQTGISK
jgi:hypothetical protein